MSRYSNVCPYVCRDGMICNNNCWREYCAYHHDKVPFKECLRCGKLTQSKYQLCNTCGISTRSKAKYEKNKLLKIALNT